MTRRFLVLVLGVALSILAGCDGSSSNSDKGTVAKPGNDPQDSSGSEPAEIDTRPNSAAGAVRRLWRQVEGGSPAMVLAYHPRIRDLVGSSGILTVFNPAPTQFSGRPQILSVGDTPLGKEVSVRSKPPGSKTTYTSLYLLGRSGKQWLVRFDSNLNNAVASYVSRQAQNRIDPNAKRMSLQATTAGDAAARELRGLFTPGPRNGRLVRP
jgi:hypothetical protein